MFEKQIYTIDNQGEKQIKALDYLKQKNKQNQWNKFFQMVMKVLKLKIK